MKRHLLLLIVFCLGKICQAQIVSQILLVENNTAHRYFFSRCVSDFSSSLMIKDTSFYSNIVPVSYTHLDVYKRQKYWSSPGIQSAVQQALAHNANTMAQSPNSRICPATPARIGILLCRFSGLVRRSMHNP